MNVRENIKFNVEPLMDRPDISTLQCSTEIYELSASFIATTTMCHEAVKSHLIIEIILMP